MFAVALNLRGALIKDIHAAVRRLDKLEGLGVVFHGGNEFRAGAVKFHRHEVEFGILHVAAGVFGAVRRGVVDSVAENIKSRRVNVARVKNFRHHNLHLSVRFGEVGSEASDQSAFVLGAESVVAGAVLGAVDKITVIALFHIDAAVASDSRFRRRVVFKSGETVIFSRAADKSEQ